MTISLIVAFTRKYHIIGLNGKIPWSLPRDMARFKQLTAGTAVIMGSNTLKSIGHPLPHRLNIVVTKTLFQNPPSLKSVKQGDPLKTLDDSQVFYTAPTIESAISLAKSRNYDKIFFCGGSGIYKEGIRFCDTLYITVVNITCAGDTFWPRVSLKDFCLKEKIVTSDCTFLTFKRAARQ